MPRQAKGNSNRQAFDRGGFSPLRVASWGGILSFGIWSPAKASCLRRSTHHFSFLSCFSWRVASAALARGLILTSLTVKGASSSTLPSPYDPPEVRFNVEGPLHALGALRDAAQPLVMLDGLT